MSRILHAAAIQCAFGANRQENIERVSAHVEVAAADGAQVILPPELFESRYFCTVEDEALFELASPLSDSPAVRRMAELARKLGVAIPTSFFERDGQHHYNSLAMIGPDGEIMGVYRKSHIPDGPGYEEKYYFRPGGAGFRVWNVFGATIGVGICWDQWYPEAARAMALMGAEALFYPSAIGSEPYDTSLDTSAMWQRAMQGHAVSNCMTVVACNRIGSEQMVEGGAAQSFYGHSFITDEWGEKVAELGQEEEGVVRSLLDLDRAARHRAGMGFFRDRRPELYGLLTATG